VALYRRSLEILEAWASGAMGGASFDDAASFSSGRSAASSAQATPPELDEATVRCNLGTALAAKHECVKGVN